MTGFDPAGAREGPPVPAGERRADAGPGTIPATAVVLGPAGVLLMGPPGAGKTMLARRLVERAAVHGRFAALVADDRVILTAASGRLVARPPAQIAGLAEMRGFGIRAVPFLGAAVVRLVAELVGRDRLERMPEADDRVLAGVALPRVRVPGACAASAAIIEARLAGGPFEPRVGEPA